MMQGRTKCTEPNDKVNFTNVSQINTLMKYKDGTNICMIEAKLPMPSLNSPPKFESFSTLPKEEKKSIIIK